MLKSLLFVSAMLTLTLSSYSQITSLYTDLAEKRCRTIESNPDEGGWYRGICPGVAGYKLEVIEGDLRQTLNVITPNKKKHNLDLVNVSGRFSSLGPRAEWRMNGKTPTALIFRFNASTDPDDGSKTASHVVVAKITRDAICITDVIAPGKLQNTEARRSANNATSRPCKYPKLNNIIGRARGMVK
jgi:hypothetical protein